MPSRWELLLDRKPVPILDHLLDEVAQLLGRELERWPLPIEELDAATGASFAGLLSPDAPPPDERVYPEAIRLTRWELQRAFDAYDDYVRNQRWSERGLPPSQRPALMLIHRWLLEQLLALGESTHGRLKRAHLLDCLDRLSRLARRSAGRVGGAC